VILSPEIMAAPLKIEEVAFRKANLAVARDARPQKSRPTIPESSRLTPELKGFIDRLVVPILVKGYVEKLQNEKSVADSSENGASAPMNRTREAEVADDSD
jgi:hypothetical protein